MYIVQLVMALSILLLGLLIAVFSHQTLGIIASVGGIVLIYCIINERRNQPRQW